MAASPVAWPTRSLAHIIWQEHTLCCLPESLLDLLIPVWNARPKLGPGSPCLLLLLLLSQRQGRHFAPSYDRSVRGHLSDNCLMGIRFLSSFGTHMEAFISGSLGADNGPCISGAVWVWWGEQIVMLASCFTSLRLDFHLFKRKSNNNNDRYSIDCWGD